MSELTPDIAAEVVAACQANADEANGALSRALDAKISYTVGEAETWSSDVPVVDLDGPGLLIVMQFGEQGVVALLPAASGLLPEWVPKPDPTGESKLATLAQELSMLWVPETLMADDFRAGWVDNLAKTLALGELAEQAGLVSLELTDHDKSGRLALVWPCAAATKLLASDKGAAEGASNAESAEKSAAKPQPEPVQPQEPLPPDPTWFRPGDFSRLPGYAKHLLKIEVPVIASLVTKKLPVQEVVEIGPGSMINFDKSCDAPLELMVGNRVIAIGSAMKVGEKFGFEITEIKLPPERFKAVQLRANA